MIANHGRIAKYDHEFEGRNSRLDGLQAAILSVKLKYLSAWTERRIEIANHYSEHLKGVKDLVLPIRQDWAKQVYHLFVIRTDRRDELKDYLAELGIQTGVHYPISLPKLAAYEYTKQAQDPMFANQSDKSLLSLPIGEHLEPKQVESVVSAINRFFLKYGV
jgi:dTDP-4-amino-4,6-dideoxygalactose transaminase